MKSYVLNDAQKIIIKIQLERLKEEHRNKKLHFNPQFEGCGILSNCEGDLYYESTLVEIKAGERNILSTDLKQLIVYCALNWLSKNNRVITKVEIFSPRQGISWISPVNELILSISSLPTEDLFEQIGKYLYNDSVEIEL